MSNDIRYPHERTVTAQYPVSHYALRSSQRSAIYLGFLVLMKYPKCTRNYL